MQTIKMWFIQYIPGLYIFRMPVGIIDIIEIILLSFLVYTILVWIKNTRAWTLLKGIVFLGFFVALIYLFHMDTLIFIINKGLNIAIIAAIIIFQPELRKALEILGEKMFLVNIFGSGNEKDVEQRCSDKTVNELVRATVEMAKVKTGALIVLEQNETLEEYERTGIDLDALVSSQLLINIFEHNTPLHDGAVIIRDNRIVAATCYLPLSDNLDLNKSLGTRHRAGVGISEVSDSLTIIVSEETGKVSYAMGGSIFTGVTPGVLREQLNKLKMKSNVKEEAGKFRIWKGRGKDEGKTHE